MLRNTVGQSLTNFGVSTFHFLLPTEILSPIFPVGEFSFLPMSPHAPILKWLQLNFIIQCVSDRYSKQLAAKIFFFWFVFVFKVFLYIIWGSQRSKNSINGILQFHPDYLNTNVLKPLFNCLLFMCIRITILFLNWLQVSCKHSALNPLVP